MDILLIDLTNTISNVRLSYLNCISLTFAGLKMSHLQYGAFAWVKMGIVNYSKKRDARDITWSKYTALIGSLFKQMIVVKVCMIFTWTLPYYSINSKSKLGFGGLPIVIANATWCVLQIVTTEATRAASPSSAAYMRQWIGSALVQIMAYCLFDTKPLSTSVQGYCQLDT